MIRASGAEGSAAESKTATNVEENGGEESDSSSSSSSGSSSSSSSFSGTSSSGDSSSSNCARLAHQKKGGAVSAPAETSEPNYFAELEEQLKLVSDEKAEVDDYLAEFEAASIAEGAGGRAGASFMPFFMLLKLIILPRQARDKQT